MTAGPVLGPAGVVELVVARGTEVPAAECPASLVGTALVTALSLTLVSLSLFLRGLFEAPRPLREQEREARTLGLSILVD